MHVLVDARLLHRPLSGLERVQRNLIRELAAIPGIARLRVAVQHGTRLPASFPARAEPVYVHNSEDILRVLLAKSPADRPDVYHLTWFPDHTPRDLWLPIAAKASVVEVHDAILNRHPEYYPDRTRWEWYHSFVRALVRSCDRLLCHSRSVVGEVARDLGGDPTRCDVAPLAVDPSLREPLAAAAVAQRLQRLGVQSPFLLALGKDYPHKDHATLFRALARLDTRVPVVCAGSQVWNGVDGTRHVLAELGMADRVRWLEGLDDDDVKALMQGAVALVYPSREEGFGLPPIEAMALGTPVVAAASMSIPEVCGDAAFLFPTGDVEALAARLRTVLAGGPEVAAMVARGRKREAGFSWARCAQRTFACYEKAVAASERKQRGRPTLNRDFARLFGIVAGSPFNSERELQAWQERCLSVEHTLGELRRQGGGGAAPAPAAPPPASVPPASAPPPKTATPATPAAPRPRFSLKRRMRKIRDGLRRRRDDG